MLDEITIWAPNVYVTDDIIMAFDNYKIKTSSLPD